MAHGNILITGETGCGKSNLLTAFLTGQIILFDLQKGATAWTAYKHLLGLNQQVILEDLDDLSLILPLSVLPKISATDAITRRQNERWSSEVLLESLMRLRGSVHADENPMLTHTYNNWTELIYGQEEDVSIQKTLSIFHNEGDRTDLIIGCQRQQPRLFWADLPSHPSSRERIVGALDRLLEPLRGPAVDVRLSRSSNFIELIDQGFSYLVEGGQRTSQAELRFICSMRLKEIIRYKQSGGTRPLTIIIEESQLFGLTLQEANYLRTLRKNGVRWIIIAQEANWD